MFRNPYAKSSLFFLAFILLASYLAMSYAARNESAIMDELAHISAGYSYVTKLDYRINPEHPPLVKALSGVGVLPLHPAFPDTHTSWTKDINGQWDLGTQFLYMNGNSADAIIQHARIFPIILTLLTIILIYIWGYELLGPAWALLPAFLFGLSPTVLAHGHYVTTDIGASFGVLLGMYLFIKFLYNPSIRYCILAGIGLGIGMLMKFSVVLLVPFFILLTGVFYWAEKKRNISYAELISFRTRTLWFYIRSLFILFCVAGIVIYLAYALFTIHYPHDKQISDTEFILESFSPQWLAHIDITFVKSNILKPLGHYLLGFLMVLQRSAGGNTGYFLGEVSAAGSHLYFPIIFLLKETLPALILLATAIVLGIRTMIRGIKTPGSKMKRFLEYLGTHFGEFSMICFIALYWIYSIRSPLNIGVRHLLPTFPLMYLLVASAMKSWVRIQIKYEEKPIHFLFSAFKNVLTLSFQFGILAIFVMWQLMEVGFAQTHYLSYFNELGGGMQRGYRYATDSNYDWGQDLKYLQAFIKNPPGGEPIQKIAIDYFGGGNPKYYLGENVAEYWQSSRGNPKDIGIEWFAVSINSLENALGKPHPGFIRKPEDEYSWLTEIKGREPGVGGVPKPDYRAGTSIFIYHL